MFVKKGFLLLELRILVEKNNNVRLSLPTLTMQCYLNTEPEADKSVSTHFRNGSQADANETSVNTDNLLCHTHTHVHNPHYFRFDCFEIRWRCCWFGFLPHSRSVFLPQQQKINRKAKSLKLVLIRPVSFLRCYTVTGMFFDVAHSIRKKLNSSEFLSSILHSLFKPKSN